MKRLDLVGKTFGRLIVKSFSGIVKVGGQSRSAWNCLCECGKNIISTGANLNSGNTSSCGCLHNELLRTNPLIHGHSGKNRTPTYGTWKAMLSRCNNPKNIGFKYYGGRGITVCPEWSDYAIFLKDMGERPYGMTIDRKDVNGHYNPKNCRWATNTEQSLNKRLNNSH